MSNSLIFAKRNLKEIMRDPLSLIFNVFFPVLMLFVFELIISSMDKEIVESSTPQFMIERLAPSLCVFSFSFLMLFTALLVAKDRTSSFLSRIKSSPLKNYNFIFGYTLPMIPLGLIQIIICYLLSFIFGLKLSFNLLLSVLTMLPIMVMYIFLGVLLGSLLNEKAAPGIASVIISLGSVFGGMFMPLDLMKDTIIYDISYALPFANSLKFTNAIINANFKDALIPFIITISYTIVISIITIILFSKKKTN